MTILRSISSVFSRMSSQLQGQDVERHNVVIGRRAGSDVAALASSHSHGQGVTSVGFCR